MPAAFQVLLQLRALWTGVMFWFLMGRKLSGKQVLGTALALRAMLTCSLLTLTRCRLMHDWLCAQWVALVILCAGAILSQTAVFEGDGTWSAVRVVAMGVVVTSHGRAA